VKDKEEKDIFLSLCSLCLLGEKRFGISEHQQMLVRRIAISRPDVKRKVEFTAMEDVAAHGLLITYPKASKEIKDCRLRFKPVDPHETIFECPSCGTRIKAVTL
jgi:hypothetical protein